MGNQFTTTDEHNTHRFDPLPDSWWQTTIGSLAALNGGSFKTGPFGTLLKASEYSAEGVPIVSVSEIGFGTIDLKDTTPKAPDEVIKRLPEYRLRPGDIGVRSG